MAGYQSDLNVFVHHKHHTPVAAESRRQVFRMSDKIGIGRVNVVFVKRGSDQGMDSIGLKVLDGMVKRSQRQFARCASFYSRDDLGTIVDHIDQVDFFGVGFLGRFNLHEVELFQVQQLAVKSQYFSMSIYDGDKCFHHPRVQKRFHGHLYADAVYVPYADPNNGPVSFCIHCFLFTNVSKTGSLTPNPLPLAAWLFSPLSGRTSRNIYLTPVKIDKVLRDSPSAVEPPKLVISPKPDRVCSS